VCLTEAEVDRLAEYLGLSVSVFTERFGLLAPDRKGLMLAERPDGACILLEGSNCCLVQPVKPKQCQEFPNGWNFPGFRRECQAHEMPPATTESETQ